MKLICDGLRYRTRRLLTSTLVCLLSTAGGLHAQAVAVAEVDGVVSDTSGKVMVNVPVTLIQAETQTAHTTVTDAQGHFAIPNLPPGPYVLDVKSPGFKDYRQTGIVLEVGKTDRDQHYDDGRRGHRDDRGLRPTRRWWRPRTARIAQVMDQRKIVDLPLNGRNLTQLLTLTGGGTTAPAGDLTGSKNIQGSNGSGTFSVAGGQANGVNYLLDGGDNNDTFSNVNLPIPFPDAVQEFSVQTNALQAQFGLHPGGVVNVVTKSGTNALPRRPVRLSPQLRPECPAQGPGNAGRLGVQPARDSLKRNQFGGTAGGKIIRDKLFFFGGYQQTVQRSNPGTNTAHVPTALTSRGISRWKTPRPRRAAASRTAITLKDPTTGNAVPGQHDSRHRASIRRR